MTDAQHVPTPDAAAVPEPAATEPTPQGMEQQVPVSDGTPEVHAETPQAPVTEQPNPQSFEELERLRAELAARQQRDQEYETWQQQQAQAVLHQQREAARQQYDRQLADLTKRVTAVDTEDEAKALVSEFVRGLAGQLHGTFQQQIAQKDQYYQAEIQRTRQELSEELHRVMRPAFADKVLTEYGLPATFKDALLKAASPDDMPAIAQLIQTTISQSAPQVQQQVAAQQAQQRRADNTDAMGGVSGGPIPQREPEPMRATSPESLNMLGAILGIS